MAAKRPQGRAARSEKKSPVLHPASTAVKASETGAAARGTRLALLDLTGAAGDWLSGGPLRTDEVTGSIPAAPARNSGAPFRPIRRSLPWPRA
jgi:hypothetical protein